MELGAADYIVKPFSPTELTARVRAALRRRAEPDPFVLDDLVIRKLGDDAARPAYLFTERGVGYRMPEPSDS